VLDEERDGVEDGALRLDRVDVLALDREDLTDLHGTLPLLKGRARNVCGV